MLSRCRSCCRRDPSSWDLQTLQDLGPLVLALNRTTLSLVAEREKSLSLLRALAAASAVSPPRRQRSTDRCLYKPITSKNIDDIFNILFSPDGLHQLDLCLSNDVLIENLEAVLDLPIPLGGLQVLKKKVNEGSGIPEQQLRRLGPLSWLYTEKEISKWSVTSSDTISALLNASGGLWKDSQVQKLLTRFLELGGDVCNLQEEQIQQIPAGAIRKAQEAFASLASTPSTYYCQIRPYLGGAPAEDLKDLAIACVAINMDLSTFLALNPEELQKLSVTDVKCLLGENLCELKKAEHEPSVVSWVQLQSQRELDCVLGIGLQGGRPEPTGTACPAVTCPAVTSPPSGTSTAAVTTSPQPATSASVSPVPTTLPPVPSTSPLSPPRPLSPPLLTLSLQPVSPPRPLSPLSPLPPPLPVPL
ncbi:hypothetical protein DV515_00014810 [Chloebia gouldiae]|uniref:MSLNL n=1 Tax=Chloebia gouldiae TaxID=44316 RepID=A0A3L8RXJ2_CHLGU|nr:hypothetical protein DV515_00014810 [Chloebia gouldiae]